MMLAGIPVRDRLVLEIARRLRESGDDRLGETLERAYDAVKTEVGLTIENREAILRALDDPPDELSELRSVLLTEHVGRKR